MHSCKLEPREIDQVGDALLVIELGVGLFVAQRRKPLWPPDERKRGEYKSRSSCGGKRIAS